MKIGEDFDMNLSADLTKRYVKQMGINNNLDLCVIIEIQNQGMDLINKIDQARALIILTKSINQN